MPFSKNTFDDWIGKLVGMLEPKTVLDIGAGAGKYGKLIRAIRPQTITTAIEPDHRYIQEFNLNLVYTEVLCKQALGVLAQPRQRYDLVILGDVMEHMRKSEGLDLLNFLIYRSGYICIVYPDKYEQDDYTDRAGHNHPWEAHISTWSLHDFADWDVVHREWDGMRLFLIKGYQPSRMAIR